MRCAHPLASLSAEPYRIHFPADLLPLETDGSIPHLRCVFNKWEKPRQKTGYESNFKASQIYINCFYYLT